MKSKVVRFLLSLVIALGIWLYVVSVVSPESEAIIQAVPVILEGEDVLTDRNLIIVSGKNFHVDLKLFGNRVDLNKLTASNITIVADLSQITEPGEHNVRYSIIYPNTVEEGNVDALERNPQYIQLTVVERAWKDVPVKVDYGSSRVPNGYVVERQNPKFDHATVTVSGPKETLDHVHHAKINVDLTGQTSTIVGNYQPVLCDVNGTPLEQNEKINYVDKLDVNISTIKATIEIYKIKEVPLVVEVIPGGGLTENDVTVTKKLENIVVSGSDAALEKLDEIVVGQIYLSELRESTDMEFAITMPAGINNVTGVTKLEVNVELLQQLEIRTFTVKKSQIRFENIPGNRHVDPLSMEFSVEIRGTAQALDNLKEEDIIAIVDCSDVADLANMTITLKVIIQIAGDSSGVGAVGEYKITVEVTEISSGG